MKKLFTILIFTTFLGCAGWSGQAKVYKFIPSDEEHIVQSTEGLEIKAKHEKTGLYAVLSAEEIDIRFGGQRSPEDMRLWGFCGGIEKELLEGLNLFFQVGYFYPEWNRNGELMELWGEGEYAAEGVKLYMENELAPERQTWDAYSIKYYGNVGAVLGANWIIPISERTSLNLSGAYRYLTLQEKLNGEDYDQHAVWWCIKNERSFSGFLAGIEFEWKF